MFDQKKTLKIIQDLLDKYPHASIHITAYEIMGHEPNDQFYEILESEPITEGISQDLPEDFIRE